MKPTEFIVRIVAATVLLSGSGSFVTYPGRDRRVHRRVP